jgi:outer membrane protein assembly factor BamB
MVRQAVSRKDPILILFMLFCITGLILSSGCIHDISGKGGAGTPPDILSASSGWPLPNEDYSNSRYSNNSLVNSQNVQNLSLIWTHPVAGAASNPLIIGDIVLFQDLASNIAVINLSTGKEVWKKEYNITVLGPNGVAAGYGKVFVPAGRYKLAALSLVTGDEIWITNLSDKPTVSISTPPLVWHDLVYVSTVAGGEGVNAEPGGGKGVIYALEQQTGAVRWTFDTVHSPDLWGNPGINYGGGSYQTPGLDPGKNLIFFGTANGGPSPGTDQFPGGSSRPGPNLYTNSILALRTDTGSLAWATQVYPHDLFNYGMSIPPVLAREEINGISQDVVIAAGKTGRVYAMNRTTGAILWEAVVGTHQNDQLAMLPPGTTRVWPGGEGGVETPMAYAFGKVYVPVIDQYADYTPSSSDPQDILDATGELVALEASSGKIVWIRELPSANIGGATVVNDLVFTGTLDGVLLAYNRETGEELWRFQGSPGITGWPAVSGTTMVFVGNINQTSALLAFQVQGAVKLSDT